MDTQDRNLNAFTAAGEGADSASDHLSRAGDHAGEAAHHAAEAGRHTKEAMEAGASGTLERAREAGSRVGDAVTDTARSAGQAVGHAATGAADVVADAGRAVGHAAGSAAHAVTGRVGSMADRIAEKVGGWWASARGKAGDLPEAEREAWLVRFESPAYDQEVVEEVALSAFALGYLAAQNPDYRGQGFDSVEPDVRHGYEGGHTEYDAWRDFTRYGYERGTAGW